MLVKDTYSKVNFIDENDVFVGYDLGQICCENAYYSLSYSKTKEDSLSSEDCEDYVFDTNYFKNINNGVQFKMTKENCKHIYLSLINMHNGYYSHGFESTIGGQVWEVGRV